LSKALGRKYKQTNLQVSHIISPHYYANGDTTFYLYPNTIILLRNQSIERLS
jgi:hypothetical protein